MSAVRQQRPRALCFATRTGQPLQNKIIAIARRCCTTGLWTFVVQQTTEILCWTTSARHWRCCVAQHRKGEGDVCCTARRYHIVLQHSEIVCFFTHFQLRKKGDTYTQSIMYVCGVVVLALLCASPFIYISYSHTFFFMMSNKGERRTYV